MSTLDVARKELALAVLYLNKAEARDKICRAIQYGSKFVSNGEAGTAQNVDKSTSLARKVFRLFKFVNDLHTLISPTAPGTPLPIVLLGKSKNALLSTFLFLDQIVWLHKSGIYKNKERAEIIGRISLYCWMGSSVCTTLVELGELGRLSKSMKKLTKELKGTDKYKNEQYRAKLKTSNERKLALIKAAMDVVVAVGLLQLSPKKITPRVTGAFGFTTSLISCYQYIDSLDKSWASVEPPKTTVKRMLLQEERQMSPARLSLPTATPQTNNRLYERSVVSHDIPLNVLSLSQIRGSQDEQIKRNSEGQSNFSPWGSYRSDSLSSGSQATPIVTGDAANDAHNFSTEKSNRLTFALKPDAAVVKDLNFSQQSKSFPEPSVNDSRSPAFNIFQKKSIEYSESSIKITDGNQKPIIAETSSIWSRKSPESSAVSNSSPSTAFSGKSFSLEASTRESQSSSASLSVPVTLAPSSFSFNDTSSSSTSAISLGKSSSGFGLGSSPNPSAPKQNPFGAPFGNAPASTPITSFTTPPSGGLFKPASFSVGSQQPSQPPQQTSFGASSGIFGGNNNQSSGGQGFGQPARIGSGQQALGSVLGSFGQSRQFGAGLAGSVASPSPFGGGFGGSQTAGGFATASSGGGGFASLASGGGGGFAAAATGSGGFTAAATGGGGFGAAATGGGGFGAAATGGGGFSATPAAVGGFGAAPSLGGGFGTAPSLDGGFAAAPGAGGGFAAAPGAGGGFAAAPAAGGGFAGVASGGFGGFSSQGGSGFSTFGSSSGVGTGKPPSELFTQMRK